MERRFLGLHENDNVAIALEPAEPGDIAVVAAPGGSRRVVAAEAIRELHKIAVTAIAAGGPVRKYGHTIGYATAGIDAGGWVHTHNLTMGRLMEREQHDITITPPEPPDPIRDRYFLGFPHAQAVSQAPPHADARRGGKIRAGTRNYLVIASTVDCSARVVEMAVEELAMKRDYFARRYANVDGIVGLTHDSGCGLVSMSTAHRRQNLVMRNLIDHPNVGASVVVQLGCEKSQAGIVFGEERIVPLRGAPTGGAPTGGATARGSAAGTESKIPVVTIQEGGGTWESVERVIEYVEKTLLPAADRKRRVLVPASELVVALQCGGSDAASGMTANAAIGRAADLLVACGAAPFISETTETFGAEHLFASRAASPQIAGRYLAFVEEYRSYLAGGDGTPEHNLSHGNKERGLTTIAEKSLGAIAKAGSTALEWTADYGERVTGAGMGFMNGPAYDPASATGQTAGGAQVGVFSTGAGSCFGGILAPWIKVVSNTSTFERMIDMEVNAGGIVDGTATIDEVGRAIFEYVLAVSSGARTYSEKLGYSVVNIWNSGTIT